MKAKPIVDQLLEADEPNPKALLDDIRFDDAAQDILEDARRLWTKLDKLGFIDLLKKFDDSSKAQAVLRLALERRGSLGAERAYKQLKRETQFYV